MAPGKAGIKTLKFILKKALKINVIIFNLFIM